MLEKIFIENFLSINEKEELKVSNRLTTLIGKNAVGKSTILRAIEKLNGIPILDSEKNKNNEDKESTITGKIRLTKKDIKDLNKKYKETDNQRILRLPEKGDIIILLKVQDDGIIKKEYYNESDERINLDLEYRSILCSEIKKELQYSKNKDIAQNLEINLGNVTDVAELIKKMPKEIQEMINEESLSKVNAYIDEYTENKDSMLPEFKFVYMNSFRDILVDTINIDEIEGNQTVLNFMRIAEVDPKELKKVVTEENSQKLISMQNKAVKIVTNKFKRIFTQVSNEDEFEIQMNVDTLHKKLFFWVKNNVTGENVIPFSSESEGTQWYLSVYLKLYEYLNNENYNNRFILLLDEPNIYLHAAAQKDLLENVFKNELKDVQIIYSTHSPYMIDTTDLFSIRIISRNDQTHISNNTIEYLKTNKLSDKMYDADVLSPVLLSIGINIGNQLVYTMDSTLIVVEGPQDYYILHTFMKKLKIDEKYKIIPCNGATKIPFMCGYLFGMGYKVIALFDGDKEGLTNIKQLKDIGDNETYIPSLVYRNINNENVTLEDMFSKYDLKNRVGEKNTINYRKVYDTAEQIEFDKETMSNFSKLFDEITEK